VYRLCKKKRRKRVKLFLGHNGYTLPKKGKGPGKVGGMGKEKGEILAATLYAAAEGGILHMATTVTENLTPDKRE